jgi:hypothetical protein
VPASWYSKVDVIALFTIALARMLKPQHIMHPRATPFER